MPSKTASEVRTVRELIDAVSNEEVSTGPRARARRYKPSSPDASAAISLARCGLCDGPAQPLVEQLLRHPSPMKQHPYPLRCVPYIGERIGAQKYQVSTHPRRDRSELAPLLHRLGRAARAREQRLVRRKSRVDEIPQLVMQRESGDHRRLREIRSEQELRPSAVQLAHDLNVQLDLPAHGHGVRSPRGIPSLHAGKHAVWSETRLT